MGTRWRGLLAPIDKPTGDGRRMAKGSISHRELPLALKWQRIDNEGHDDSVIVGLVDTIVIDEAAGEVWGEGELFDDADPAMPRLAEDVAEALHLLGKKVIGPSVDAGAAEAIVVVAGTDEPITDEEMEHLWDSGEEPDLEMLFTAYEIAAATLVAIPAFGECRPFELLPAGEVPAEEEDEEDDEETPADESVVVADHSNVAGHGILATCTCTNAESVEPLLTRNSRTEVSAIGVSRTEGNRHRVQAKAKKDAQTATASLATTAPAPDRDSARPATKSDDSKAPCPVHSATSAVNSSSVVADNFASAQSAKPIETGDSAGSDTQSSMTINERESSKRTNLPRGNGRKQSGAANFSGQRRSGDTPGSSSRGTSSNRSWNSKDTSAPFVADQFRTSPDEARSAMPTSTTRQEIRTFAGGSVARATGGSGASWTTRDGYARLLRMWSITASAGVSGVKPPPDEWFENPGLTGPTPITVTAEGRVFGTVAAFGTCHTGIPGVCTTAPSSASDYVAFHRYTSTAGGVELPTAAGRITAGHGAMAGVCQCCPGNDDHACSRLSFGGAVAHHDPMRVLAYVRAGEDEHGIWVAGVVAPEADDRDRQALARQRFSGDWREVAGALELTEVLALSRERPGFPLPRTSVANGRQHALVAAGAVRPVRSAPAVVIDYERLGAVIVDEFTARGVVPDAAIVRLTRTVTAADGVHTGAMVALVPSEADAARLAVEGGLLADDLHLTLMYLGEAADIGDDVRQQIVDAVAAIGVDGPVEGDGFAVSVFNPGDANDRDTAIVLGVGGAGLDAVHTAVGEAVTASPEQHMPWVAHVTLIESDDASLVAELTDRVGPVVFDRIRVAFGGDIIDIPLGGQPAEEDPAVPDEDVEDGASLADRGALLAADLRAMDAAELAGQLDAELRARDAADLVADLAAIG